VSSSPRMIRPKFERQSLAGTQVRLQAALVWTAGETCQEPWTAAHRLAGDYDVMPTDLDVYRRIVVAGDQRTGGAIGGGRSPQSC